MGARGRAVGGGRLALALVAAGTLSPSQLLAQSRELPPRPPAPIGSTRAVPPAPALLPPSGSIGPPTALLPPGTPSHPGPAPGAAPSAPGIPIVPPGQAALMVSARFGSDSPAIPAALHWRVYADRPDANGIFRLVKEDHSASPTFVLPAGGYVVDVNFGLVNLAKRVELRSETLRETFDLPAGGARFEGRVGDSRIPPGQISFDVYPGSQFEPGERRKIAQDVGAGQLLLLPEGTYNVVSNYGDGNAVTRADIRVRAGKLTDVTIRHRAAVITLKLMGERGGEALANTAWSVLTPGGDVIKESIGAFPRVVLAEGDYVAIARNEGNVYNREFKVEAGVDREIEVLAK